MYHVTWLNSPFPLTYFNRRFIVNRNVLFLTSIQRYDIIKSIITNTPIPVSKCIDWQIANKEVVHRR